MTGWNLPPGVNVSDIPGNRPEDEIWEKESNKFCVDCPNNKICNKSITECERSEEFEKFFEQIMNGENDDDRFYEENKDRELDRKEIGG
jgi:hypothetical protein